MDTVIVYVDDAEYARQLIHPMAQDAAGQTRQWVLVACAPRMTHRISKWVSHSARESWRAKWADKLFAQVLPWFDHLEPKQVDTVLAKVPLPDLMEQLHRRYGADAQLVDARRPKQEGVANQPAATTAPQPAAQPLALTGNKVPVVTKKPSRTWALPSTLAGLFCMMFVAVE